MNLSERAEQLAQQVLAPLVRGGPLRPVRPVGPALAFELGREGRVFDDTLRLDLATVRTRRARRLAPVGLLPDIAEAEWVLAAGFNDILQTTNHELSGLGSRGRHLELARACLELCESVPRPRTPFEALARHATFAHAFDLTRTDTEVKWWVGSAHYRGQKPPQRILYWKDLRNVRVSSEPVGLLDMDRGTPISDEQFAALIAAWLAATPLTDLAFVTRVEPAFAWTRSTLALVATPMGRDLALRAFMWREASSKGWAAQCRQDGTAALEALSRATRALRPASAAAAIAHAFVQSFEAAVTAWSSESAKRDI